MSSCSVISQLNYRNLNTRMIPWCEIRRRQIRTPLHDDWLRLWQAIYHFVSKIQMVLHHLFWRQTQPLVNTNIRVLARLQDLYIVSNVSITQT